MAIDPVWEHYYRDEMDAAWLYRQLASREREPSRRSIFERLAGVEDAHVERWRALFKANGGVAPEHSPSFQTRMLSWLGARFGS